MSRYRARPRVSVLVEANWGQVGHVGREPELGLREMARPTAEGFGLVQRKWRERERE